MFMKGQILNIWLHLFQLWCWMFCYFWCISDKFLVWCYFHMEVSNLKLSVASIHFISYKDIQSNHTQLQNIASVGYSPQKTLRFLYTQIHLYDMLNNKYIRMDANVLHNIWCSFEIQFQFWMICIWTIVLIYVFYLQ